MNNNVEIISKEIIDYIDNYYEGDESMKKFLKSALLIERKIVEEGKTKAKYSQDYKLLIKRIIGE